jgi:large subunit ribosomal protein L30
MATDLKVTQIRSVIGKPEPQRKVLAGMGLRHRNHTVILPDTPEVRGMIFKVPHLIRVERIPGGSRHNARERARSSEE